MKKILVLVLIFTLIPLGMVSTKALLKDKIRAEFTVKAASLDFKLNGDSSNSLIGEVKPGDSGTIGFEVKNTGTLPGELCVKVSTPPEFTIQLEGLCGRKLDPDESLHYEIEWLLPPGVQIDELVDPGFVFSFSFRFENGFKVTKNVTLEGIYIIPDYAPMLIDLTPTPTQEETQIPTITEEATITETPTFVEETAETATEVATQTPVEVSTQILETPIPPANTDVPPAETPEPATEVPPEPAGE